MEYSELLATSGIYPSYPSGYIPEPDPADPARFDIVHQAQHHHVNTCYGILGLPHTSLHHMILRVHRDLQDLMIRQNAEAYVVRGASGVVFGGAMTFHDPNLPMIVARKDGEGSHCGALCSAAGGRTLQVKRYVIVDDFISGGGTVRKLQRDLQPAWCVGILLYQGAEYLGRPVQSSQYEGVERLKYE